jgi:hypothetical protein
MVSDKEHVEEMKKLQADQRQRRLDSKKTGPGPRPCSHRKWQGKVQLGIRRYYTRSWLGSQSRISPVHQGDLEDW